MRFLPLAVTAALAVAACKSSPPEPRVEVEDARVQLPVLPGRPGAAYFTLSSNNDPTKLVSVTSPGMERIELHETVMETGIARMRPSAAIPFPADGELVFAPGRRHAMLFGIDPALQPGDKVPLTFNLDPMGPVTVQAEVQSFTAGAAHEGPAH